MINYVKGDLFLSVLDSDSKIVIPHITNDIGAWGSGFVVPLGKHYPSAKREYLEAADRSEIGLGLVQKIDYGETIIANMCSQRGILSKSTGPRSQVNSKPIKYASLVKCMEEVASWYSKRNSFEIHAPKFGSDRAGGNWLFIQELIEEIWGHIPTTVYVL